MSQCLLLSKNQIHEIISFTVQVFNKKVIYFEIYYHLDASIPSPKFF